MARHLPLFFSRSEQMMSERLFSRRLELRPPHLGDAPAIAMLIGNWNVVSQLSSPPYPYREEDALAYLDAAGVHAATTGLRDYAICRNGRVLGVVGIGTRRRRPELGYWLGEPYWGKGYMTEAADAVVAEFFSARMGETLFSRYFAENLASRAVQRKLGFEVVGKSRISCRARNTTMRQINTRLSRTAPREA